MDHWKIFTESFQFIILLFLHYSLLICPINAQIPRLCAENVTLGLKTCCPILPGQYEVCGGKIRGECKPIKVYHETVNPIYHMDDRYGWPIRFFEHICECKGNYFGTSCEQCKYGWEGNECNQPKIYVRRNIFTYNENEKNILRHVITLSQSMKSDYMLLYENDTIHSDPLYKPTLIDVSIHEFFAALHRYASRHTLFSDPRNCLNYGSLDYNHGVTMFALWHRYFIMLWERELRKIAWREYGVKEFSVPYWDWIDNEYCEVCINSLMGAEGEILPNGIQLLSRYSPFHHFLEYCQLPNHGEKCTGCHFRSKFRPLNRHWDATQFPTTKELMYIFEKKKFFVPFEKSDQCDSFHKAFEGFCGESGTSTYLWMHNRVHNMVTGSFCCAATAANDPLFILHHSQVDRIFQAWFAKTQPGTDQLPTSGVRPGQFRYSNLVGFYPIVPNEYVFKDTRDLGYTFDSFEFGKHGLNYDRYQ